MSENKDLVSFQVSESMVNSIVEKQIQMSIVQQLGNKDTFVESIITTALHHKVCSSGTISNYSSDNKYDFLDIAIKNAVRKTAEKSINEWVKENGESLKKQLKKVLDKEKNKKQILQSFLEAGLSSISSWNFKCNVDINQQEKDY